MNVNESAAASTKVVGAAAIISRALYRDHREKYVFPIISSTFVVHRTIKVCLHTNKQYC